ncbi:MAG: Hsp70 family protein [Desulfamplus sp.]|nr:Hsp70 family protein [Desulfamplus sp.]
MKENQTKEENSTVIGIDLGTSNSLASYIKNGSPRIIPNERGERMTPSVVHFKENGDVIVGQMAKNQAVINSDQTVSLVKLSMGTDKTYNILNKTYSPVDISSMILAYLKKSAETYLGYPVTKAVITVPAYFNDRQREDTLLAAQQAGLKVLKLLNEPIAAALVYGFSNHKDTRLLVVDLGGGTLDISLISYEDKVFRVRGVGGSTRIGGSNFDLLLVNKIMGEFKQIHGIDLHNDKIALQQLLINAEKAKIDLSSANETQILIPYITVTPKGPIHLNVNLTRNDFEQLIASVLKEIAEHIKHTFENASISNSSTQHDSENSSIENGSDNQIPIKTIGYDWVDSVILVGGSTRLPVLESLVRQMVCSPKSEVYEEKFDKNLGNQLYNKDNMALEKELKRNIHPDEAVARGAGLLAGILEGSIKDIEFHDITAHDLGIEDDEGSFISVIPKGSTYPLHVSHIVTNTMDNQESVLINVLQRMGMAEAESEDIISIGWFELAIDSGKKKYESSIEVTFSIDSNGILEVTALDIDTGEQKAITITNR